MVNNPTVNSLSNTAPPPKHQTTNHLFPHLSTPPTMSKKLILGGFLMRFRVTHTNLLMTLGFELNTNYFANGTFPMSENIYFEYAPKSISLLLQERKSYQLLSDQQYSFFFIKHFFIYEIIQSKIENELF